MKEIRIGIVGIGNCASSLVQGIEFYRRMGDTGKPPGIMHPYIGEYGVESMVISAAIDLDQNKVGLDLSEAIFASPNNTIRFAEVPFAGVRTARGNQLDGIGGQMASVVVPAPGEPEDIARLLRDSGTEILVNFLPVGSEVATCWYAEQALEAGCGFVNCIPVFITRQQDWRERFRQASLPLVGDDIKSQVGATIVHRVLARLFEERGVRLDHMSQLNVGGNTDFLNMLDRTRLESKRISKTSAVTSQMEHLPESGSIHIGPSDYVSWLSDRKWAYIRIEGTSFGNTPINLELKLEVWDSPNSAGVVIDAIRCCKLAMDAGIAGAIEGPSAYYMKAPPVQHTDEIARRMTEEFIAHASGLAGCGKEEYHVEKSR